MNKAIEDELENEIIDTNIQIGALNNSLEQLKKDINNLLFDRKRNRERLEDIEKRLDEIRSNVINVSEQEIKGLEKRREIIEENIIELSVTRRRLQDEIDQKEDELKQKRKEIEETRTNNEKQEKAKKKKILSEKCNELAIKLFTTYAEEKRQDV
jgi:chromosome segregation ATPase